MKRDFLHITDYSKEEFWDFIDKASWIKDKVKYGNSVLLSCSRIANIYLLDGVS